MAEGKTVLVVDDDRLILDAFRGFLERSGYRMVGAQDVGEAFVHLCRGGIDLVIADVEVPGLSGTELPEAIKRATPTLPVVVITGSLDVSERGADRLFGKPVELWALREVIRELLCDDAE